MRPTSFDPKYIDLGLEYLGEYQELGHAIPSVVGYCKYAGVAKSTVYDWAKKFPEFSDIVSAIGEGQELDLINGSLVNKLNPQISKTLLGKHGYSDRVEQDVTSSDGSMTPQHPGYKIVKE
jgi:hypothetical protein